MKIPEHLAISYLLAQLGPQQAWGLPGTLLMMTAGMLPDLDGVSILGGWNCHLRYHRKIGHGLPVTLLGPLALALLFAPHLEGASWWELWLWLQLSLLAHLFTDLLFYGWKVQLLWPLSNWGVGFGLVGWNDLVPTLILYTAAAVALAWPVAAPWAALAGVGLLATYTAVRARRKQFSGFLAWLTGGWVDNSFRLCRWLTGDFVT